MQKKSGWGFDTGSMDTSVRPQDDFYRYANGNWLKKNAIPSTESRWGSFNILRKRTEQQVLELVIKLTRKKVPPGSEAQLVADLYLSGMDMERRNALGIKPVRKILDRIYNCGSQKELSSIIGMLERNGVSVPWGVGVDQDSKNSSKNVLHLYQSGLGMPDRDYYLKNEPEFIRVRTAYAPFIARIMKLAQHPEYRSASDAVMRVETALARVSMDKVDVRDAEKTYHKFSLREVERLAPQFEWKRYWQAGEIPTVPYAIVTQPEFVRGVGKLLDSIPLADWKVYLAFHTILDAAPYLSASFVRANFDFYGRTLAGQKAMKPLWRRTLGTVNGTVGYALGKEYIRAHFGTQAKRAIDTLVDDLFDAYEARMKKLPWMTPRTKKQAIEKLRAVSRKIGYPKKWKSYRGLIVRRDDFFGNIERATTFEHRRAMRKLTRPVDRTEWHMTPQTVNAYCNFNLNEVVFPAAILQHPFFSLTNDVAVNYGAIGSVIGHELTHAFDDQGSKFDKKGNLKSWWTHADRSQFEKRATVLVEQYDSFTVSGGVRVNGKLTLGENIADLGGLVIAYDALLAYLSRTKNRETIDDFTPEQRFFLGFAQQEQELVRPEYAKLAAINDPHSPAPFRINGPLSHMDAFYEVFSLVQSDRLYRAPSERARIW